MKKLIQNKKVFYAGLIYLISILCYIGVRLLWQILSVSQNLDSVWNDLLFTVLVQGILFCVPIFLYALFCREKVSATMKRFFFRKISLKAVRFSIILGILTYIIVVYAASIWSIIISTLGYNYPTGQDTSNVPVWIAFLVGILSTAVLPGLCEETAHRGLLLGNLRDNGLTRAILLSALMFGLAHLNITQFGYTFVVGLILGTVTLATRSIFPAIIIHGTSNLCSMYSSFALDNDWVGSGAISFFYSLLDMPILGLLLSTIILLLTITGIVYLLQKLFIENKIDKLTQFRENLKKSVQGTEMENMFDFNDQKQMIALYNSATEKDIQQKLQDGKMDLVHLENEFKRSSLASFIYNEVDDYSPPNKMDYIFLYISIFMMSLITILTFIWGAM
jgi:membrane protease YdiL (CAAX protease family)